ncbi:MAG: HAMP domain-containing protein [Candidatus Tectomicrobia bacterium]|uniref:histidine kinase n=1 Tax=Tectimicrobiota bacterium TaxID=2528274 RepID=A0A932CPX1_UNCTE|nr:HAMP domain-containing protein [Candidatus Tectomicrobia bacterium]
MLDSLVSQASSEMGYFIFKDTNFLQLFGEEKRRFQSNLISLKRVASTSQQRRELEEIDRLHQSYCGLFEEKARSSARQNFPERHFVRDPEQEQRAQELVGEIYSRLQHVIADAQVLAFQRVEESTRMVDRSKRMLLLLALTLLGLGLAIAFFQTRRISRPILELKRATEELANGNFDQPLEVKSRDEIGQLAASFSQMCQRLKEVDQMKADFLSNVSHTLRTPLASITAATGLILEEVTGTISDSQRRLFQIIEQECKILLGQIGGLLDLSKMEAGMMSLYRQPERIGEMLEEVAHEVEPLARSKRQTLELSLEAGLPTVPLDRHHLRQALLNLLNNAVKFSPEGESIVISARLMDSESLPCLLVSISDRGDGIPEEDLERIFDKFYQSRSHPALSKKGTGLGLPIARHIVEAHGGKIWAESELGQGSTFYLTLPA